MKEIQWTIKLAGAKDGVTVYKLYSGKPVWWNFCGIYAGMENVKFAMKVIQANGK